MPRNSELYLFKYLHEFITSTDNGKKIDVGTCVDTQLFVAAACLDASSQH